MMIEDGLPHGLGLPVGELLPDELGAYRPLVSDAFAFFLDHLPPHRTGEILAEQLRLPADVPIVERITALMRRCPTLHKLAQVMARDRRLPRALREGLQQLESLPPSAPVGDLVTAAAPHLARHPGLDIAAQPLAEGSVAVVVPFEARPEAGCAGRGVLKVLKPGIAERLDEDLEVWEGLAAFIEERAVRHRLPALDYRDTLEKVRSLLRSEVRLDLEQAHLAEAARLYADAPRVLIPRLLPFSTPRVTAMERVPGRRVTQAGGRADVRRALAEEIVTALVATPFWHPAPRAMFHADPHAGNLFCTPDGRLAILDWSLVTWLTKAQREAVTQLVLAGSTLEPERMERALAGLGATRSGAGIRQAVHASVQQVRAGVAPGFEWLVGLLDRLVVGGAMAFPEQLLFFRKALHSLAGVVADVSEAAGIDPILLRSGLQRLCSEVVSRPFAPLDSRAFGTHLSSADLLGVCAAAPLTAARWWLGVWQDALQPGPSARGGDRSG
jgi:ubiquinone biosynthesis protein